MRSFTKGLFCRLTAVFFSCMLAVGGFACGSSNGGGGGSTNFNQLLSQIDTQSADVNSKTLAFGQAYQGFYGVDFTGQPSSVTQAAVNAYVNSGNAFITSVNTFNSSILSYNSQVSGAALQFAKFQSVDPLFINGVGGQIDQAKTGEAACAQQFHVGQDNEDLAGYNDCIKALKKSTLSSTFNFGLGATVSGGAGVLAGGAAAAASAPVWVVVGTGIAVGVIVGLIWTKCTSSSNISFEKNQTAGDVCTFNSCRGAVTEFANGQRGIICAVPPGTGFLSIQGGGNFNEDVTIPSDGLTLDLSGCNSDSNTETPSDAKSCQNNSPQTVGVAATSTNCGDVSAISANAVPPNPAVGQGVTVTAEVFPNVSGCPVAFSISGTDGFSKSDTPSTDASGDAVFTIPGAASAGVVDTVTIMINSVNQTIVYTFGS